MSTKAVVPNVLKYQFKPEFDLKISDKCCLYLKEKPLKQWQTDNKRNCVITGIRADEGGRREQAKCKSVSKGRLHFNPLVKVDEDFMNWLIEREHIQLCDLYGEPYNFTRTGCKGCPFALKLQEQLETMEKYFPVERKQCEIIWKPVYDEYRRIGYRLKKEEQLKLF